MNTELTITLSEIQATVELAKSLIESLKEPFEQTIKNKEIPLNERWELWCDSPVELKQTQCWIVRFASLPEDFVGIDGSIPTERRETVFPVDIVSQIQYDLTTYERHPDWYDDDYIEELRKINLDNLKEEILEMNLWSFDYDW